MNEHKAWTVTGHELKDTKYKIKFENIQGRSRVLHTIPDSIEKLCKSTNIRTISTEWKKHLIKINKTDFRKITNQRKTMTPDNFIKRQSVTADNSVSQREG